MITGTGHGIRTICWLGLFTALFAGASWAWTGKVIELEDGDSGRALKGWSTVEFRLYGIDAPEHEQPFSRKAKSFVSRRLLWKEMEFRTLDRDQYGREVGLAYRGGRCINEQLIESGLAWVYRPYCKESFCTKWMILENQARGKRAGLWRQSDPTPPWEFRRSTKTKYSPSMVDFLTGLVKGRGYHGNVSSKVFHSEQCKHYNCKNCTARFSSRDEALRAGFKPCSMCRP
ncbi:thermonuclease family protein [Desulfoferrobacter suflitae]|uniref:thermonuclease family protein n=1 Tax=Desulfoferrobacter suflitae TaxID=2865782 RepID=UPI002164AA00|nr:thermonuclease family protein [Desulfoferrobacter suflitae]MCK8601043.1 thermonuclease family protein [Desulfoferrobacter suflitae]